MGPSGYSPHGIPRSPEAARWERSPIAVGLKDNPADVDKVNDRDNDQNCNMNRFCPWIKMPGIIQLAFHPKPIMDSVKGWKIRPSRVLDKQ